MLAKLYARKCLDRKCLREPDFLVRALKFFYVVFSGLLYIDWSSVIFMKPLAKILTSALLLGALAVPFMGRAADPKTGKDTYPLTTCVVSDEKLGGDMGAPYIFTYKDPKIKNDPGREVRLCCTNCLKDFKKDPTKYLKKIDDAAKAKK